jgi:deoxyguanosine kinase
MFICIEGNIGSGKTTLAKELAKRLKALYLPETFEENTMLPLFYQEPKKYAFLTEYSFLLERQKQLINHFTSASKRKITVSDYHFDKCICFANVNLKKDDLSYFSKHFKAIQKHVPKPDLIVYLEAPIDLVIKNIEQRNRTIEKKIKKSYLISLKKSLDSHYLKLEKSNDTCLVIHQHQFDKKSLDDTCAQIIKSLKHD